MAVETKKSRIRLFAIAALVLLNISFLAAQTVNVKDVRQTYLWDVTLSMQGKAAGCPDIWDKVKNAIIADIQQISDDRTEIVVIPFQHKALEEWREYATAAGKAALVDRIKSYKIPLFNFNGRMTTMTCLYEPLQYVVDNVLSPDKVDILKLMTDGIPDEHQAEYEALLERWCQIAQEKDAYGFYIMLTSQAVAGHTVLKQINPCRFDAIDVAQLNGTNVSFLVLAPQQHMAFNVREDYGKKLKIKYLRDGNGIVQQGYKVHVWSEENQYIHVDQVVELHEDCTVTMDADYLMPQTQMTEALPVDENEKVILHSEPAEGMDQLPYLMTRILDAPTTMEMINKPEKTVKFHVQ